MVMDSAIHAAFLPFSIAAAGTQGIALRKRMLFHEWLLLFLEDRLPGVARASSIWLGASILRLPPVTAVIAVLVTMFGFFDCGVFAIADGTHLAGSWREFRTVGVNGPLVACQVSGSAEPDRRGREVFSRNAGIPFRSNHLLENDGMGFFHRRGRSRSHVLSMRTRNAEGIFVLDRQKFLGCGRGRKSRIVSSFRTPLVQRILSNEGSFVFSMGPPHWLYNRRNLMRCSEADSPTFTTFENHACIWPASSNPSL